MDNLFKQMRVRFSNFGEEYQGEHYNTREGKKPPQKTVSSKEERKKTHNWLQRQFSGQISDVSNIEFATAVAAAAYAITLLVKEESLNKNKRAEQLTHPTDEIKSKREDSMKPTDYSKLSRRSTAKEPKEDETPGYSSVEKPVTLKRKMLDESGAASMLSGKTKETNLTIKKTPTFSDKYLNNRDSSRSERGQNQTGQQAPSTIKPPGSISGEGNGGRRTTDSTKAETEVDAWAREKMDKIRTRYEKMNSTILEWENEKKSKANRRLEQKQEALKLRRKRASDEHHHEILRINKIVGEARTLTEARKTKDENKTLEKMHSTGKVPRTCFCF